MESCADIRSSFRQLTAPMSFPFRRWGQYRWPSTVPGTGAAHRAAVRRDVCLRLSGRV